MKSKVKVAFEDDEGKLRFLFRVLNFGKESDELKFQFVDAVKTSAVTYSENDDVFSDNDISALYAEITYHSDGSLHHKFPSPLGGKGLTYVNPYGEGIKRKPLSSITEWEPVIKYTIVKYHLCPEIDAADVVIQKQTIFNGEPFFSMIFLGFMAYDVPPNEGDDEMVIRINDIGHNLDVAVWLHKTDYRGHVKKLQGTDIEILVDGNIVEIVHAKGDQAPL